MNCSKCQKSLSGISSKVIEEHRYCIACVSDLISKKSSDLNQKISNYADKKCTEARQDELKKTPRMGRVSYIQDTFFIWILFPFVISKILVSLGELFSFKGDMLTNSGFSYESLPLLLWFLPIIIGMLYTDSRVQDVGWSRWLALILWLPVINIILCLFPGTKEPNRYGVVPKEPSRIRKILAVIYFVIYLPISIVFILLATVIGHFV